MHARPIEVGRAQTERIQFDAGINHLLRLGALARICSGAAPADMAQTLLDALLSMLRLDFVYLRMACLFQEPPFEAVRVTRSESESISLNIQELLGEWVNVDPSTSPCLLPRDPVGFRVGGLSTILLPLGLRGEIGVLAAGFRRADFPVRVERLLLSVAANQAAIGMWRAHLGIEQTRVAETLEQQVEPQIEQLAAANKELRQQIASERALAADHRKACKGIAVLKPKLEVENPCPLDEIHQQHNFEEILGNSPKILKLLDQVQSTAPTDANVLIIGETGSGKELIARAIHRRSPRRNSPLVKVNCGAIPSGLVESELFGHVKGAFTSASERRVGRFELANDGTLFLDEVGELPLDTQVKLLRVLQEHEFEPVGSNRTIKVNVRIIAATNRDLEKTVQSGGFRSDLYYRLNVIPLHVPALRERRSDIPEMAMKFLRESASRMHKPVRSVSRDTMQLLVDYSWPGNIRELQNVIERGVVLSKGPVLRLDPDFLPIEPSDAGADPEPISEPISEPKPGDSLEAVQRHHILRVLDKTGWVISGARGAGAILEIHPNTLRSLMNRLGIRRANHARGKINAPHARARVVHI